MEKPKNKNIMDRFKESLDDKEEQLSFLSVLARLVVLAWSGAVITVAYVSIPGLPKQDFDVTFISSVFVSTLTTFGVQTAQAKPKNGNGGGNNNNNGITKAELKELLAAIEGKSTKLNEDPARKTA